VHTGVWWRDLKERDHVEDIGVDGRIIVKWINVSLPTKCTIFKKPI
jgi:hypothetical protein